jgi:hypothetical protein
MPTKTQGAAMSMRVIPGLILGAMLVVAAVPARSQAAPDTSAADAAWQAENWQAAAEGYAAAAEVAPANGRNWYRLAVAYRHLGKHAEAAEALKQAEQAGVPAFFTGYELAKSHAGRGDEAASLAALESAAEAGLVNVQGLEADAEFDDLRGDTRFAAVVEKVRRNAMPCEFAPAHREFDFWIGEWDVVDANGTPQGKNTISKEENGCVLVEKWAGAGGSGGMSMNFYDPGRQKWVQQWVSGNGGFIEIEGGIDKGSMVLTGSIRSLGSENSLPFRGTWTLLEDGRVRQFFEQSNDDGETWFEGFYSRK